MPTVTIYVPAALAARLDAKDIPVSKVCQHALTLALDKRDRQFQMPQQTRRRTNGDHGR